MPYADVEKRRAYQRERKRQQKSNHSLPQMATNIAEGEKKMQEKINVVRFKIYVCPKYPGWPIGLVAFNPSGFLVTADPHVQAMVEAHKMYGKDIFSLLIEAPGED